jgi:ribosomal protein L24E
MFKGALYASLFSVQSNLQKQVGKGHGIRYVIASSRLLMLCRCRCNSARPATDARPEQAGSRLKV